MEEEFDLSKWVFHEGKYEGKNILEVSKIDPQYLDWILKSTDYFSPVLNRPFPFEIIAKFGYIPSPQVKEAYDKRAQDFDINQLVLNFGKYKGMNILQVFRKDHRYLDWVLKNTELFNSRYFVFFPFEAMAKYGYIPSTDAKEAYDRREEEFEAELKDEERERIEAYWDDLIEDAWEDEMGEVGEWNID